MSVSGVKAAYADIKPAGGDAAWIVLTAQIPVGRIPFEQFYGDKVTLEEVTTLNGRTGVWAESESVYMFICGLTDPNITLLQFLPLFLIVCVDAARRVVREPVVLPAPVRRPAGVRGVGALVRVHPRGADA